MTVATTKIALPPANYPLVTDNGVISLPWYQAILGLFNRTGGATGLNTADTSGAASAATSTAQSALLTATNAAITAGQSQATASSALAQAQTAVSIASGASANNLTKSSLIIPITFQFSGSPRVVSIPIVQSMSLPANFAGYYSYAHFPASVNTTFALQLIRFGVATSIGTLTFTQGSHAGASISGSAAVNLQADDVLKFSPLSTDVTLADCAITLALSLG